MVKRTDPEDEPGYRWLELPGIYCDIHDSDYYQGSGVIRITFGEYTDKQRLPFFRTAVVIPVREARRLRASLDKLIREAEAEAEAEASAAAKGPAGTPSEPAPPKT